MPAARPVWIHGWVARSAPFVLAVLLGVTPGLSADDSNAAWTALVKGGHVAVIRSHGVRVDRILSSPMYRCKETGELMGVGAVETSFALLPDTGPSPIRFLE
jgi:hypothetical protein